MGIGPLLFGPLSDTFGRKPIVYIGFGIFIVASFICVSAQSLEMMLLGRMLQGIGLSAPRTISISIIRDAYSGDYMARIMSFVTVIFLLVPIIAPALGKFILDVYGWKAIFYIQLVFVVLVSIWFYIRQPETLLPEDRKSFTPKQFISSTKLSKSWYKTNVYSYQTMPALPSLLNVTWSGPPGNVVTVYLEGKAQLCGDEFDANARMERAKLGENRR